MGRMALVALVVVAGGCARKPAAENDARALEFRIESQPVRSLTARELTHSIKPGEIEVFEPYEKTNVVFTALPLERVFDEAYGPSWREREAILFTCRDGYQPTIPVRRLLDKEGFLAIDRPGDVGFSILKEEEGEKRRVALAPFYVVWENLDDAHARSQGDYGWPYQVVAIDLVSFRSRFGAMAPPDDASAQVLAGFEAFVVHCSKCHAMNGQGGALGPELNTPANPTEYMKDAWLRRWIDDPASMRLNPRMPPLNRELPARARVIDEIVAYLAAMASHKVEPREP
ncbi:MAG: cytochrome c [Polyangiales bacterium]